MQQNSGRQYWITSGIFTILQRFGAQLFGLGMVPILFRQLSKTNMGVWALYLTTVGIIEVSRAGLIQNALIKHITSNPKSLHKEINTASLALNIITTLVIIALIHLTDIFFPLSKLGPLLMVYTLTTVLLIPFFQFNQISQANLDFKGIFISDTFRQGLLFLYILITFLLGFEIKILYLAYSQVVFAIVASLISWYYARNYLSFSNRLSLEWLKKLFHFGKYTFGTNVSTMLYKSIDKYMISDLISAAAVAIYEAAIKVTNLAEIPTFSMASILFPQSSKRSQNNNIKDIRNLYVKAVAAILTMILPAIIFVLLFADWIIYIIAGVQYQTSGDILRISIFYGLFIPFAVQFGTILDSVGRPKINFYFTLAGALLNVILNYFFIKQFGIHGAVYGTLITYFITFVAMQSLLYKMYGVTIPQIATQTLKFYKQLIRIAKTKLPI